MGSHWREMVSSLLLLALFVPVTIAAVDHVTGINPVIIIGAGMSGISAAKTLSDAGITNFLILEGTDRIGGRMCKKNFSGINVEIGANWVEGVNGNKINPVWEMANKLELRRFYSDFDKAAYNTYSKNQSDGTYERVDAEGVFENADDLVSLAEKYSETLPPNGSRDISILAFQRLLNRVPRTAVEMAVDYYYFDYEYGEPPSVTSLQNTNPGSTFEDFGEDFYFVADQRGYESLVLDVAQTFLHTDDSGIHDSRLLFRKVVNKIRYTPRGVMVETEDGSTYQGSYVLVSASLGVLQSELIQFQPSLPTWKRLAIDQFDMVVYTKIFIKFPYSFWPTEEGTNFFLYANDRRGYYPAWQHFEVEYPGSNVLLVTVTDVEARRIEQQPDSDTMIEVMGVLKDMFGPNIPNATDILVPRWWSDRLYKGSFSNWPIGVDRYEYDPIRAPVGRVYFTGEHTSTRYNGYVHGALLSGIDSANVMIDCILKRKCKVHVPPKYESQ